MKNENLKSIDLIENIDDHVQLLNNPSGLGEEEKIRLARELLPVAASGFMRKTDDLVLAEDVYDHLFMCDRLKIIRDNGGFARAFVAVSLSLLDDDLLYHLEGVVLASEIQQRGLAAKILSEDIEQCNATLLAFHTQSMSMLKLGNKLAVEDRSLAIRSLTARSRSVRITAEGLVIDPGRYASRYGGCLYGDYDQFEPLAVKAEGFDYRAGDAVMFAGRVKKRGEE